MNTLPKEVTAKFWDGDPQGYDKFDKKFRELASNKDGRLTSLDYLIAQVARGRDWTKSFGEMSNQKKLANGGRYNWELYKSLRLANYIARNNPNLFLFVTKYDDTLTVEGLVKVAKMLPQASEVLFISTLLSVKPYKDLVINVAEPEKVPMFKRLWAKLWD